MSGPEDTRSEERRGISNSHQENILQNTFATTMFITFALKVFDIHFIHNSCSNL